MGYQLTIVVFIIQLLVETLSLPTHVSPAKLSYTVSVVNYNHLNNIMIKSSNSSSSNILNVITDCHATGDGTSDDSDAIQTCFDTLSNNGGGEIYFPPGNYLISQTITISNFPSNVYWHGSGWSSIIYWSFDNHLFYFQQTAVSRFTIRDMAIYSTECIKSYDNSAFYFDNSSDVTQSLFDHLLFSMTTTTTSKSNNDNNDNFYISSGINMNRITDTTTFTNILMWFIQGIGIKIGYGSEVRIIGGRIIGIASRHDNSIGIYCTGNNGGVHIENTDVIGLDTGLLLNNSNNQGSNREIFITQATFDSDNIGIAIADSSYVNINGIWAASSDTNQVWVAPNQINPILVISGGTIFNGGVYGGNINCDTQCNGITVNSGTFILNDVAIRNNQGKGIWIPNDNVVDYIITGCKIFDNGVAYELNNVNNDSMLFANNVCNGNGAYTGRNKTLHKLRSVEWRSVSNKFGANVGC